MSPECQNAHRELIYLNLSSVLGNNSIFEVVSDAERIAVTTKIVRIKKKYQSKTFKTNLKKFMMVLMNRKMCYFYFTARS